jgi:L-lactate dehydrogenase complex protein LldG
METDGKGMGEVKTDGQHQFIENVRAALGYSGFEIPQRQAIYSGKSTDAYQGLLDKIRSRTENDRQELLQRLIEEGRLINLKVIPQKNAIAVAGAIADLVMQKTPEWDTPKSVAAWSHPLIDRLNLAETLSMQNVPVYVTDLKPATQSLHTVTAHKERLREQVVGSFIGITSADFCVSETATLVIKNRPGQPRFVSLVPTIHVAVIEMKQIISNLQELYALLKRDLAENPKGLTNCMTFITGPSRTADIELSMVQGAHGPRELYLYVITG